MNNREAKLYSLFTLMIFYILVMLVVITDNPKKDDLFIEPVVSFTLENEVEETIPTITIHKEEVVGEVRYKQTHTLPKEKTMVICFDEFGNTTIVSKSEYKEMMVVEKEPEVVEDEIELFSDINKGYEIKGRSINYITQEEFDFLVSIVSAEARGESFEGQVAVVDVILNRVDCDWYPDTITGVITQKGQFESYWADHYKTAPHTESVINAVLYALENQTLPKDVLFFRSNHYHTWGDPWKKIGNHYFSTSS